MTFWKDRIVLVTGASSGLGAALAVELAGLGVRLILTGRDPERLQATLGRCPGAIPVTGDLASPATLDAVAAAVAEAGRLDMLFNNAGIQQAIDLFGAGGEKTEPALRDEIEINLVVPILLSHRLAPWMLKSAAPVIVNIGSGLGMVPKRSAPVYSATKAGMRAFSLAASFQGGQTHPRLRVAHVTLPVVATPMTAGRHAGAISAESAARSITQNLADGRNDIFVGKARFLPLLMRIAPRRAERIFAKA